MRHSPQPTCPVCTSPATYFLLTGRVKCTVCRATFDSKGQAVRLYPDDNWCYATQRPRAECPVCQKLPWVNYIPPADEQKEVGDGNK